MTRRAKVNREEFLRLHHEGRSLTQLADQFHITTRHATRLRKDLGVAQLSPKSSRRVDAAWKAAASALLDDGVPMAEVARTLGWNEATVARHFPGRGWDRTTSAVYAKAVATANAELRKRGIKPV
jgi:methylphosphotriester-DNA--protein-cysteine methyltransferase